MFASAICPFSNGLAILFILLLVLLEKLIFFMWYFGINKLGVCLFYVFSLNDETWDKMRPIGIQATECELRLKQIPNLHIQQWIIG